VFADVADRPAPTAPLTGLRGAIERTQPGTRFSCICEIDPRLRGDTKSVVLVALPPAAPEDTELSDTAFSMLVRVLVGCYSVW
jgi:hypothetical protein